MERERIEALVSDYLDGTLEEGDAAELLRALSELSEARRFLLVACHQDLALADLARESLPELFEFGLQGKT